MPPRWGRKAVRVADLTDFATSVGALIKGRATVPQRVNLVTNGSFDTDVSGWNASRATLTRDTTRAVKGASSARGNVTAAGGSYLYATVTGITVGTVLTVGYSIWDATYPITQSWLRFENNAGATILTTPYVNTAITASQWNRITLTHTVPVGATRVVVQIGSAIRTTGDVFWVDEVTVESLPFATDASPFTSPQSLSVWDAITYANAEPDGAVETADPLDAWRQALTLRTARPVNVFAVGDSITEGTGATTITNRWINLAQTYLRNAYGVPGGATFPFIPAQYITTASGRPSTSSGTVTANSVYGLGWRSLTVGTTGEVSFTFTGTSAKLAVTKASSTGIISVTVNGGTPVTYDTNSSNGGGAHSFLWPVPGITARGTHTITVRRDAASTLDPVVQGLHTFDGDEGQGVRIYDAAHHGYAAASLNQTRIDQMGYAMAATGADLIILALGTNDIARNNPAEYRTQIDAFIAEFHESSPGVPILLVHMYRVQSHTDAQNSQYRAILADIASGDPLVKFVDLRRSMPDVPTPFDALPSQGLYAEGVHPSDYGYARIADLVAGELGTP